MNHEIMMYAIAQKEGLGLDVRAAKCPHRLDSPLTIAAFVCAESRGRVQV